VPEKELPALYDSADIFIMPSLEEGFGMTVTEAMASGTPVVASNIGGIPQQIEHNEQGLLVEPGKPDELATQIEYMLTKPEELRRMSEYARDRAHQFSWDKIGQRFESVYQDTSS
jgi:glycosyltransferase involved in cell wall biosynthesis